VCVVIVATFSLTGDFSVRWPTGTGCHGHRFVDAVVVGFMVASHPDVTY